MMRRVMLLAAIGLGAALAMDDPARGVMGALLPRAAATPPEVACPVQPERGRVVITQGYGPMHSGYPRETFGALDLAVDGDGDGQADPEGSWGAPVVAIDSGVVEVTYQPGLAGWHVWLETSTGRRWGYAHLEAVLVASGEHVVAGQRMGSMGASGQASGPHLDLQRWEGATNADPTPIIAPACWPDGSARTAAHP